MNTSDSSFGRATNGGFQGFCPECGAVSQIFSKESEAEAFEYSHRAQHENG